MSVPLSRPTVRLKDLKQRAMKWKVGQAVVCDRPGQHPADCHIRVIDMHESTIIFCPSTNTVICGQRRNLERLGWRLQSPTGRFN